MLEDAGYKLGADGVRTMPDGTPMAFKLTMVQGFTDWISAGEIMVQNWKDVGIDVETTMIDPGAYFGSVPMGDYEIAFWFGYSSPTPYGQYMKMMGAATVAPWGRFTMVNFTHYGSPPPMLCSPRWHPRPTKPSRSKPARNCRRSSPTRGRWSRYGAASTGRSSTTRASTTGRLRRTTTRWPSRRVRVDS